MGFQTHKPSFRNVPFHVQGASGEIGRRVQLHEYPLRDDPYAEDLGRKRREFSLEAYVVGKDYAAQRDRLIEAIEQGGPGTLVHPYRGTMQVVVTACRYGESTDKGGMATFAITFAEAGQNLNPAASVDTPARVAAKAENARAAAADAFAKAFSVSGQPAFVGDAASGWLTEALGGMDDASRFIQGMEPALFSEYVLDGQRLSSGLAGLMGAPADLAGRMVSRMAALLSLSAVPQSSYQRLKGLFAFGQDGARAYSAPANPATPARRQQAANEVAVTALTRQSAVITAAEASSAMDFASFDEAATVREDISSALESEAESADDATYLAMMDLRAAVVADIGSRGADLARVVRLHQPATLPALVVAHRVYGDASREAEIVARNGVRHPGFVPGGRPLEVLTA